LPILVRSAILGSPIQFVRLLRRHLRVLTTVALHLPETEATGSHISISAQRRLPARHPLSSTFACRTVRVRRSERWFRYARLGSKLHASGLPWATPTRHLATSTARMHAPHRDIGNEEANCTG